MRGCIPRQLYLYGSFKYRAILRRLMTTLARINNDGSVTNITIRPSYAHKPKAVENLMKGLPDLVGPQTRSSDSIGSPDGHAWKLDDSGDTIHRHVLLESEKKLPEILRQIESASRELNHDPHMHIRGKYLTISCTTHVPPGLSMKDVKLARRINEILQDNPSATLEMSRPENAIPIEEKEDAERKNMEAIKKAKEECSCG